MEYLFKMIILLPCFLLFSAGLKRQTEIVRFSQFFYYFTGFTSPSMLFFSLAWTVFFQFCFSISS